MLSLTIPVPPMRKNAKHEVFAQKATRKSGGKPTVGRRLTAEYKRYCEVVALVWDRERARRGLRKIESGALEITVRAFWETQRHLDIDLARGDIDAPLECLLDAMAEAGVYDDDVRFVKLTTSKHHDPRYPRVEVEIREAQPEGQLPLYVPPPEDRDDF